MAISAALNLFAANSLTRSIRSVFSGVMSWPMLAFRFGISNGLRDEIIDRSECADTEREVNKIAPGDRHLRNRRERRHFDECLRRSVIGRADQSLGVRILWADSRNGNFGLIQRPGRQGNKDSALHPERSRAVGAQHQSVRRCGAIGQIYCVVTGRRTVWIET